MGTRPKGTVFNGSGDSVIVVKDKQVVGVYHDDGLSLVRDGERLAFIILDDLRRRAFGQICDGQAP